jgi:hypothetical protein
VKVVELTVVLVVVVQKMV